MVLVTLLSLAYVLALSRALPYSCNWTYTPEDYVHFPHVPVNCFTTTPSACQRSWKSGIPEGTATAIPLVYSEFIFCHESFSTCGYVPIVPETGKVLGGSGVTVGGGVDLGYTEKHSEAFSHLDLGIYKKLKPYLGLRQELAACAAIEKPLILFSSEALTLTNAVKDNVVKQVEERYNRDRIPGSTPFILLERGIRTAMVSLWFQLGRPEAYPDFWKYATQNTWDQAVAALRDFYKTPLVQRIEDLRRRNDEADIIEATLNRCARSLDAVVLLDESGSVTDQNFMESLQFVVNITSAFSGDKLRDEFGTRVALSTFSYMYTAHFQLSSYSSHSQYQAAVDGIQKHGGTTSLGYALRRVSDQFTEAKGLRNERYGIPRVLIVITDGQSHDSVLVPAQKLRDKNIVVYAIGVGQCDMLQLMEVATSQEHVYTLKRFVDLETFISTITAATCNEPQPVHLRKRVEMSSPKAKFQYFVYKAKPKSMLEIRVNDKVGQTLMYVSRNNPHPYKYDSDFKFSHSVQKNKVVVISVGNDTNVVKRAISKDEMELVYVSVLPNTRYARFTIEASPCVNCLEGTNEEILKPSGTGFKTVAGLCNIVTLVYAVLSIVM